MSGNNWYDNDDNDYGNESGGKLRSQLEKALEEIKGLKKELADARTQVATTSLTDLLTDKGYKPGLAKRAAADGITDADGLEKWLKDNEDWLPDPAPVNSDASETNTETTQQADDPSPELVAQLQESDDLVAMLNQAASPAEVGRLDAALKTIPEDASPEQVLRLLKSAGV